MTRRQSQEKMNPEMSRGRFCRLLPGHDHHCNRRELRRLQPIGAATSPCFRAAVVQPGTQSGQRKGGDSSPSAHRAKQRVGFCSRQTLPAVLWTKHMQSPATLAESRCPVPCKVPPRSLQSPAPFPAKPLLLFGKGILLPCASNSSECR